MDDNSAKTKILAAILILVFNSEKIVTFILSLSNKSNMFAFPLIKSFMYVVKFVSFTTLSSFTYFSISSMFILLN